MRALLVDDSEAIERYVRAIVEPAGWTLDRAANGKEALDRALRSPPDVILLDFVLPDEDGLDVLAALFAGGVHAPVVVLSAAQSPDIMRRFVVAGATDYLAKDELTPARLRAALRMAYDAGPYAPPARAEGPRSLEADEEPPAALPARTGTVLVVDDTESFRALVRRPLTDRGWRVLEASDAETALSLAETASPDVLLLDHVLPDAEGLEVMNILRGSDIATPVIALTGHGDEKLAESFLAAGAVDYLPKASLTIPRLVFALERALWVGPVEVGLRRPKP